MRTWGQKMTFFLSNCDQFQQFIRCGKMDNLPTEILEEIFKHLSYEDINQCKQVCLRWRAIIKGRRSRANVELHALTKHLCWIQIYNEKEHCKRVLGLKAWAMKRGYLYPKEVAETYLNYAE